jgi:membrane fusion protein (multidrug efflux system)
LQDSNVLAAQAAINAVLANVDQNSRDVARQQKLLSTGSSSAEAGEKLKATAAQLAAQLQQARAQANAAVHQLGVLDAQRAQAQAALAAQQATLEVARINLGYTRILAPEDGVIGQRQVKPGQLVGVGGQITTLTPLPRIWVLANYKETQLTHMNMGAPATIAVDAFPGHTLRGKVLAFAPGAGSQFALLPPDNATGNFTKVVQRVAVKISIEQADGLIERLRPGMSVVATVDTDAAAR